MGSRAFEVIELRRYTLKHGSRAQFAEYFDTYFPEAMQQLGAIAAGSFLDRGAPDMFTWLRGFHDMDDRAKINGAFYYGPVWKEHKAAVNGLIVDSDNAILLRPIDGHPLLLLPAVDPIAEPSGARGVAIAMLFTVEPERLDAFVAEAERELAQYAAEGVREAGMFVTLDEKNNFPQLPLRTDGPFVFWIGVVKDDAALARVETLTKRITAALVPAPEVLILDPSKRSRLRWRL